MRLSISPVIALSVAVAATSCSSPPQPTGRPTPAPRFPDNQYLSLAFGASISQQVPTTKGTKYLIQSSDSAEGVCNTAGTALDTYWNSTHC